LATKFLNTYAYKLESPDTWMRDLWKNIILVSGLYDVRNTVHSDIHMTSKLDSGNNVHNAVHYDVYMTFKFDSRNNAL